MIEVRGLSATAGSFALRDVSFVVPRGKWGVVTGPAGAGKTTLLETIAGIRRATNGVVMLRGVDVTDFPPERRRLGIVYQRGFLFPHLSVVENVAYGAADASYATEIGQRFGADRLHDRRVAALSGGERQIVALARALATKPDVVLLDEPFVALDQARKLRVREALCALHREQGFTVLQVTHDAADVGTLGDVVILIEDGRMVRPETARAPGG